MAQQKWCIATTIQQQQCLLARGQSFCHSDLQRLTQLAFSFMLRKIDQVDFRQGPFSSPLGQLQVCQMPAQRALIGGQNRRGAAQDNDGLVHLTAHQCQISGIVTKAFRLFVAAIMLFIDHDQPQLRQRCKDRRTSADHNIDITSCNLPPGIVAFTIRQAGMEHGQTHSVILKPAAKASHQLRRQGNFRNQDQRLSPFFKDFGYRPQINLGFAAACDAVKKKRGKHRRTIKGVFDCCNSDLLSSIQFNRAVLYNSDFSKRIPATFNLFELQEFQLNQTLQSSMRGRKSLSQLA